MITPLAAVLTSWALVPLVPVLSRLCGRHVGLPLAAGMLVPLGIVIALRSNDAETVQSVPWIPALDVSLTLRADPLSFLFSLLILGIGALVLTYSSSYLRAPRSDLFYVLMTSFAAAMLTLVMADDLLVMFVAWELTTLCSYLLILRSGPHAVKPATRTLLVTVAGGLALLTAIALIVVATGTFSVSEALAHPAWSEQPVFAGAAAALIAIAAMTKSAQFPFHSWLPDAMVAPAPVSAYLHAAAMVKAGIFLLMLFAPAASQSPVWSPLLIVVGLITALLGGIHAVQRCDIKELLAYSTVSQLGLLVALIGVGGTLAMLAVAIHVIAHALFKSACFMGVGLLEKRAGSRMLGELRGLWSSMRFDAAMLALAAVSMAGIPPMLGFVSKELLLDAGLHAPAGSAVGWAVGLTIAVGAVFTVAYSLRMLLTTLPGPAGEDVKPWRAQSAMSIPIAIAALGGVVLLFALPVLDTIVAPVAASLTGADATDVPYLALWHGVNAALILSVLAIAGGTALAIAQARGPRAAAEPREWPVTGVGIVQGLHDGTIAFGRRVGDLTRFDSTGAHVGVPLVAIGLAVPALLLGWQGWPQHSPSRFVDYVLLTMVIAGVIAVIRAGSRLAAIISAGVIGFAVVLWYFDLGASDVALTQLLVEVLTVVVMILVLRRIAPRFEPESRTRTVVSAIIAVAAGVSATLAALVFTGHRSISWIGEYYLDNAEELSGGGINVVNTILVDFRALDTMGELVVLGICAVALAALLDARRSTDRDVPAPASRALADIGRNAVYLHWAQRILVPVMLVVSAYALWRGHNLPGGGFIAALLGAAVVVIVYLAARTDRVRSLQLPFLALAGLGIVVAIVTGLFGLLDGSFLRPLHFDLLGVHLTTALVFDLGVYFAVFGVVLASINLFGTDEEDPSDGDAVEAPGARRPGPDATDGPDAPDGQDAADGESPQEADAPGVSGTRTEEVAR